MYICNVHERVELHADCFGSPYLQYPNRVGELVACERPEWASVIERWQQQNDTLRARGDLRYIAASTAASRCKVS